MKPISRILSALTLVAWGALMLYFYVSGRLNEYLIPIYRPMVEVSGAVMLLIAASIVWGLRPGARRRPIDLYVAEGVEDASVIRRVGVTQFMAFALLVVPIWAAVGVSNDQFNASAIRNRGIVSDASQLRGPAAGPAGNRPSQPPPPLSAVPEVANELPLPGPVPSGPDAASPLDASQYLKKSADGTILAEVTDLLFASDDDSMRPAFEDKKIEVTGQFMPAPGGAAERYQIVRMFMVCCAADARPVALQIQGAKPEKVTEMGWVRVVGKVTFPVENGHRIALVKAASLKPCDPPPEAMLY